MVNNHIGRFDQEREEINYQEYEIREKSTNLLEPI